MHISTDIGGTFTDFVIFDGKTIISERVSSKGGIIMSPTEDEIQAVSAEKHKITRHSDSTINGLPLKMPVVDIVTVGAGGGSIAWLDEGGALRVGPESVGASPGPICYGLGGMDVTVTDCDLLCGFINLIFK